MKTGFYKNKYCDASEINVPVDGIGLNRGYAAFDFMKVNSRPFYPDRHLERFFRTMTLLRIEISYSKEEVRSIITKLTQKNEATNYGLKFFAIPIDSENPDKYLAELFIIPVEIPTHPQTIFTNGISLITKEHLRFFPEAKSTNYLPALYWANDLKQQNAFEILYCYKQEVLETSRSNIFIVKDDKIYTPKKNILMGVTRSIVLDILKKKQIPFEEKTITTDELFRADEVFITGTTKTVMPVVKIDGKTISDGKVGKISQALLKAYNDLL